VRRTVVLAALIVFLIAPVTMSQDEGQPNLSLSKTRHDFGKVFERDQYAYKFKVTNRGQAELLINDVKPT